MHPIDIVTRQPDAISAEEADLYGCPECGFRSGHKIISDDNTSTYVCGECNHAYAVVAFPLTKSTIGFGGYYPDLIEHPRRGILKHGQPDHRPEGGGEYFTPQPISFEILGCFVCGGQKRLVRNLSGKVQCREAGARIVKMFNFGVKLHHHPTEPDTIQVRIGACDAHLPNLEGLRELVEDDGVITKVKVDTAIVAIGVAPQPGVVI